MKIILLKNVDKVGRAGEIKEVSEGYGRNFLIVKGLARLARPEVLASVEAKNKAALERETKEGRKIKKLAKEISGMEIKIYAKVGEGGKLYGSVGAKEIVAGLKKNGFEISSRKIKLEKPIKDVGGHEIMVKLRDGLEAKILVRVVEEK